MKCATYLAASTIEGVAGAEASVTGEVIDGGVTRWCLVRTAPIVLDQGRAASVAVLARRRGGAQLALGGLMALALGAIVLARLPANAPLLAAGVTSPSPSPIVISSPAPRATSRPSMGPSSVPSASPVAMPGPTAMPSPPPSPVASASATPPPPTVPRAATRTYRVQQGDTLYDIAIRFGTTVKSLQQVNGMGSSTTIRAGQVLRIP